MVQGLQDGRWALISKTHHALVDGVSGVDLTTMLFDLDREGHPREPRDVWVPHPEPSEAELAGASITSAARRALGLPLRTAALAAQPSHAVAQARETLGGLAEVVRAGLTSAPETPLNVAISPHRRIAIAPAKLGDFKRIKNAHGGTVNDVVLAVVAGALRHWMHSRGLRTEGLEMKACVPVSTRGSERDGALGNRITQLIAPLPIDEPDPVERLHFVSDAMAGIKESKQALGAEIIAGAQDFAPPTILAQSSRMNFSARFYNLLVTNIPGPQFPLYLLGCELEGVYPVAFLAGDRALAIAIMSYNGRMNFGLIGDYDAMADIDEVVKGIRRSLRELLKASA
jgi:diacylglycerol O-acyltransferase